MIEYKGTPLFGEGSSVSHTSEFFAIAGTILFWLLFLIFSFVIKAQPKKPEYKEVQIVLSSTPVVQKTEEAPAPAEAASASAAAASESTTSTESPASAETPVMEVAKVQPVVETSPAPKAEPAPVKESPKPKVQTQPKKEPAKTQPSNPVPTPIYKSNEELLAEQLNRKKEIKNDYDPFANETDEEVTSQNEEKRVVKNQNSMSGKAGEAAKNGNGDKIQSEHNINNADANATYGNELDTIRNAKGIGASESGDGKNKNISTGSDNDSLIWTEGSGRSLPKIDIVLSDEAKYSMLITKETHFKISFSVDSEGNVIVSTIIIEKEAMLTSIIKNEVRQNVSKWKFGPGNGISKAQFDWILRPEN